VVSTFGDGGPPENCEKFHDWLQRKDNEVAKLDDMKFTCFALGDPSYVDTFCAMGKLVNKTLLDLGATSFYEFTERKDSPIEN